MNEQIRADYLSWRNSQPVFVSGGTITPEEIWQAAHDSYAGSGAEASPTKGMNLCERIAHVGGRESEQGYIEFGSVMAVDALINHVLRDVCASPAPVVPDRMRDALESLTEIQYFSECGHKHRAWAWDALNAICPALAEISANNPKTAYDLVRADDFDIKAMLTQATKESDK